MMLDQIYPTSCTGFSLAQALSRRQVLQAGSLGVFGLSLPTLLNATESASEPRRAKSCILIFAWGGPSQLDTWDLKPNAPDEIRGEFKPISTTVPDIQISEHFPLLARHAEKYAVIRSMMHDDPAHLSSVHHLLTGHLAPNVRSDKDPPSRRDWPHMGSVLGRMQNSDSGLPNFVTMPWIVSHPAAPGGKAPGQHGGWMGAGADPFVVDGDPNSPEFDVTGLGLPTGVTPEQLLMRKSLLSELDSQARALGDAAKNKGFSSLQGRAFDLIYSQKARRAFDLELEPPRTRDRYGRHIHGQCLLLARRLIEAGVSLVCINWHQDGRNFWDTHGNNFNSLKKRLMPPSDMGFSALLQDLSDRGLLDETLVAWVGEFGRKPQITRDNAGREHWPQCYSGVLAGGGIKGGQVYGSSDQHAAYVKDSPVTPADFTATMFHALGIPQEAELIDPEGRPLRVYDGRPVLDLF